MDFTLLLDSPREPKKTIQIAKLGDDFEHVKYGQFAITENDIKSWKRNLDKLPGHRALIDEDHAADRAPRRTEASGWITDVRLEGGTPVADIEWTPKGEQAIKDGRYLFISPTFGNFTDEHGAVHENTLIGAALTNRPFLNMPSLCLASDERVSEAVTLELTDLLHAQTKLLDEGIELSDEQHDHLVALLDALTTRQRENLDATADSRAPEMDTATLIKTLGLPEDTDEQKLLDTVTTLQQSAEKAEKLERKLAKNPVKTLEAQAAEAGLVLLDASEVQTLRRQATAGETALKELHAAKFDTAFELALNDPNGARVKPAEKERLQHFYELDAEGTLAMIAEREPLVPAKPAGAPTLELDGNAPADQVAAAGLYPDSHQLDRAIRKYMLDKNLGDAHYATVLDQWMKGQVAL